MLKPDTYYFYILASKSRVLYVVVTGFLMNRVLRHSWEVLAEGWAKPAQLRVLTTADSSTPLRASSE